jgi:hypothetical protein
MTGKLISLEFLQENPLSLEFNTSGVVAGIV